MQKTMRQVPPMHDPSPFCAVQATPHAPQFLGSLASTASHALAALPSQSALPAEQFCNRPALSSAAVSGCVLPVALSAAVVTGARDAQLPNPKSSPTASSDAGATD